jgi:uncharacterized membrane protein
MKIGSNRGKEDSNVWMTTNRIETLIDGIFAIAMTLLVLSLNVPQMAYPVTNAVMLQGLTGIFAQFYMYALSFILLAIFWRINHSQFYLIEKFDNTLLWINFLWLLFIVLVPFSANLLSDYGYNQIAAIFFHLNLFFIGVFLYINWNYAARKNFIDKKLDGDTIKYYKRVNLIFPIVALFAIALTFISPGWSSLAYFLISFVKRIF